MKKAVLFGLVLALPFGVGGCGGGGPDALMKEQISIQKEMLAILESVKDEKTADEAIPKLEKAADRLSDTFKKLKDAKLSVEDSKKLMEKYSKEQQELQVNMSKAGQAAGAAAGHVKGMKIAEAMLRSLKGIQ